MKLLLFSDLHADIVAAEHLAEMAAEVDVLVGAGDFGNMRRDVGRCIPILKATGKPTVIVPGNNESFVELQRACAGWPEAVVLHGTGTNVAGQNFFGLGGGVPPTPFGAWSFDLTESQATDALKNCPADAVLITHSPPKGTVDVSSHGDHLGSPTIRDTILRLQPPLVVCGHIHGSGGKTGYVGKTPVINAGPGGVIFKIG